MPDFAIGNARSRLEIDLSLLDTGRGAVPAFAIDLMPRPRRDWAADSGLKGGPADRRKRRKPNNIIRPAASLISNGLQSERDESCSPHLVVPTRAQTDGAEFIML